jgi:hypothetical protein
MQGLLMKKGKREVFAGKSLKIIIYLFTIAFLLIVFTAPPLKAATCTPTSAVLCAAIDDWANIYVNGQYINSYTYCDISWACAPQCFSLTPAQVASLLPTGNDIAVYTQNTACCELWASWSLDIQCSDGGQALISSDSQPVVLYSDSSCTSPNPSPTPSGGKNWYDTTYVPNGAWIAPVAMTGKKWGRRLTDPVTGNVLTALSYSTGSHSRSPKFPRPCRRILP